MTPQCRHSHMPCCTCVRSAMLTLRPRLPFFYIEMYCLLLRDWSSLSVRGVILLGLNSPFMNHLSVWNQECIHPLFILGQQWSGCITLIQNDVHRPLFVSKTCTQSVIAASHLNGHTWHLYLCWISEPSEDRWGLELWISGDIFRREWGNRWSRDGWM